MKTLVVEDSRLAREGLLSMLAQFAGLEVMGAARDAEQARQLIAEHRPELLFLDIHMPGESGFELLESLDYEPKIVFTTAYSEYAIKSFDFQTVDYLLKPISTERLAQTIDKLNAPATGDTDTQQPLDRHSRIFIKDGERCHLIEVGRIHYLESCKNYTRLFFGDDKAFVKKSLNQLEARLPQRLFFRANRQAIINLEAIAGIAESVSEGYEITLSDGRLVDVSRRNAARLKTLLSL